MSVYLKEIQAQSDLGVLRALCGESALPCAVLYIANVSKCPKMSVNVKEIQAQSDLCALRALCGESTTQHLEPSL